MSTRVSAAVMPRFVAAVVAAAWLAAAANAQYFVPYKANAAGDQAGQAIGYGPYVGNVGVTHAAVKVGGAVTLLPGPAGSTSAFAYAIGGAAEVAGGWSWTTSSLAVVWVKTGGVWGVHRTLDAPATLPVFFAYPTTVFDNGDAILQGVTYTGQLYTAYWFADGSVLH